jgi:transcriptional regulator with GAF, ATPase, and Fis domain
MPSSDWSHFFDTVPSGWREPLAALLQRSGLGLAAMPAEPEGYGLMVLGAIDDRVLECVRAASRQAVVLVLAVAPSRIAPPQQWALLQAGAADVLFWPTLPASAEPISARFDRLRRVRELSESPRVSAALVGAGAAWSALLRQVVELALYARGPVLITGESGTGKELVARLIHELDPRQDKRDLVVVDCTTITPELSGSEFFGHERGAYTGAVAARDGAFAQAHGGTLFLDEIGDLPLALQAQLLRVVQEGKYKRVGGNAWQHTSFRLVSATHCDLEARVGEGRFRSDLYFRIAGSTCRTPPLRERKDDVLALARFFQQGFEGRDGDADGFDEPVCQYLLARDYPGNVRELKRVVERLCLRHAGGGPITIGDVPEDERPLDDTPTRTLLQARFDAVAREAVGLGLGLKEIGQLATDCAIQAALDEEHGNLHRAAARLAVTDRALQLRRAQQRLPH